MSFSSLTLIRFIPHINEIGLHDNLSHFLEERPGPSANDETIRSSKFHLFPSRDLNLKILTR